eukprot:3639204-Rhodomonas_salina.2
MHRVQRAERVLVTEGEGGGLEIGREEVGALIRGLERRARGEEGDDEEEEEAEKEKEEERVGAQGEGEGEGEAREREEEREGGREFAAEVARLGGVRALLLREGFAHLSPQ